MTPETKEAFFKSVDCHYAPRDEELQTLKALIYREGEDTCRFLWLAVKAFTYGVNVGVAKERARRKAGGKNDY